MRKGKVEQRYCSKEKQKKKTGADGMRKMGKRGEEMGIKIFKEKESWRKGNGVGVSDCMCIIVLWQLAATLLACAQSFQPAVVTRALQEIDVY